MNDLFDQLPNEIIVNILQHLDASSLVSFLFLSKRLNDITTSIFQESQYLWLPKWKFSCNPSTSIKDATSSNSFWKKEPEYIEQLRIKEVDSGKTSSILAMKMNQEYSKLVIATTKNLLLYDVPSFELIGSVPLFSCPSSLPPPLSEEVDDETITEEIKAVDLHLTTFQDPVVTGEYSPSTLTTPIKIPIDLTDFQQLHLEVSSSRIYVAGKKKVSVWDLPTGLPLGTIKGLHEDEISCITYHKSTNTLATGDVMGRVCLFNCKKNIKALSFCQLRGKRINDIALRDDYVIVASDSLYFYSLTRGLVFSRYNYKCDRVSLIEDTDYSISWHHQSDAIMWYSPTDEEPRISHRVLLGWLTTTCSATHTFRDNSTFGVVGDTTGSVYLISFDPRENQSLHLINNLSVIGQQTTALHFDDRFIMIATANGIKIWDNETEATNEVEDNHPTQSTNRKVKKDCSIQ